MTQQWVGGCVLLKKNRDALSCPHIITCSHLPLGARMGTYNPDAVEMQVSVFPVNVTILLIYLWTQSYFLFFTSLVLYGILLWEPKGGEI